jgi:hypothetical protein
MSNNKALVSGGKSEDLKTLAEEFGSDEEALPVLAEWGYNGISKKNGLSPVFWCDFGA